MHGATRTLGVSSPPPSCPRSFACSLSEDSGVQRPAFLSSRPQVGWGGRGRRGPQDPHPPHPAAPCPLPSWDSREDVFEDGAGSGQRSELGHGEWGPAPWGTLLGSGHGTPHPAGPVAPRILVPFPCSAAPTDVSHDFEASLFPPPRSPSPARPLGASLSLDPSLVPLQSASARSLPSRKPPPRPAGAPPFPGCRVCPLLARPQPCRARPFPARHVPGSLKRGPCSPPPPNLPARPDPTWPCCLPCLLLVGVLAPPATPSQSRSRLPQEVKCHLGPAWLLQGVSAPRLGPARPSSPVLGPLALLGSPRCDLDSAGFSTGSLGVQAAVFHPGLGFPGPGPG